MVKEIFMTAWEKTAGFLEYVIFSQDDIFITQSFKILQIS